MKNKYSRVLFVALFMMGMMPATAQINIKKAAGGLVKAAKAVTLTDEDMANYVKEYIDWMDKNNQVCPDDNPYTIRLNKLTQGLTDVEGIPLNFKVYYVIDVNAFACPDGSVRVFSSLMDIMTDDELLGVIGHEVGHVANKDSKDAFRTALLTSALKDGVSSAGGTAAALSDSQLGELGEALVNSSYSQKQESNADVYGYDFLKKKGKNPWAIALSFEKLKKLQEDAGYQKDSKWKRMFSSHPDLDKRIERMSARAQKDGFARPENKAETSAQ
ncbi:MAG: M48 family metallopeptidase [Prevotella sp.]|nr:M48 family metallopeptidase [Prevotella sp.]